MPSCIIINSFNREAYLFRICFKLIIIETFADVHYHEFLYQRSIISSKPVLFWCIIGTFAGVHYHQFLYERNIALQNLFYIYVNRDFCWCTLLSISLRDKNKLFKTCSILDVTRDLCWRAFSSISLREKHNSSKPVLCWCCHGLLLVCITTNLFTREV